MRSGIATVFSFSSLVFYALACGNGPSVDLKDDPTSTSVSTSDLEPHKSRHDRLLGIDVNEGDNGDFERAFNLALDTGIDFVSLTIYRDKFETAPETFAPEVNWLDIANSHYSAADVNIALVIAPIDTNVIHTPKDLRDLPFDDPAVIHRLILFLDYVLTQLSSVDLVSISLGNEMDAFLGSDSRA